MIEDIYFKLGYVVNPFSYKPWLLCVCGTSLENTVGKREIARNDQLLLFPTVFSTCLENFLPFFFFFFKFEVIVCKLFQFGRV